MTYTSAVKFEKMLLNEGVHLLNAFLETLSVWILGLQ